MKVVLEEPKGTIHNSENFKKYFFKNFYCFVLGEILAYDFQAEH